MRGTKPGVIYVLRDPRTEQVRYVGYTTNLSRRIKDHRRKQAHRHNNSYRYNWLMQLYGLGLEPIVEVIDECPATSEWQQQEQFWIAYFRAIGAPLTNLTDGGEGNIGFKPTPEFIEHMRQCFTGRTLSTEHRQRVGEGVRRKLKEYGGHWPWKTDRRAQISKGVRKALAEGKMRHIWDADVRRKGLETLRKFYRDNPNFAKERAEKVKGQVRPNVSAANRRIWATMSPEKRAERCRKIGEAQRKFQERKRSGLVQAN